MTPGPTAPPPQARPAQAALVAVGLGAAVTLAQVALAMALSGQAGPRRAYLSLYGWDGGWYARIVRDGYEAPPELTAEDYGNVGFFPAYPLAAAAVGRLLNVEAEVALLLAAQAACVGFWACLLLLLRRWGVTGARAAAGVALVAAHPASFFLVASYSESLFLFALLGLVLWSEGDPPRSATLAAAHGFLMTATRLVGAPLAAYPLLRSWLRPAGGLGARLRRGDVPLLVGVVSALGVLSFFAYCHLRFGRWALYQQTQGIGWFVDPDYLAPFYPSSYPAGPVRLEGGFLDPDYMSQLSSPAVLLTFLGLAVAEVRLARAGAGGWRERAALYYAAAVLFWVPICGHATRALAGFLRHSLCPHVVLVLAGLHLLTRAGPARAPRWLGAVLGAWLAVALAFQVASVYRFTHGLWVS